MSESCRRFICLQKKTCFTTKQTLLISFSKFSTISLAFSIASVIPALLKPFIVIFLSSLKVLYRLIIHLASSFLVTVSLKQTLTPGAPFLTLNCFNTSLASQ